MSVDLRVAYQGERGAFSEVAARRLLGSDVTAVPCHSFETMFGAVTSGDAHCCVAPIENSLAGSIHRNYDLLLDSNLTIAGETNLRVVHNLIAPPGVELADLRRVVSHPVALAQCTRFLAAHPELEPMPVHDTAGAVRLVVEQGRGDTAAIASDSAAEIYGAHVLERSIEDNAQNFTRFLLLLPQDAQPPQLREAARRWKTSLVFRTENKPGALFRALGAFAIFDIDLSKIESRPVEGRPWEYSFYLDIVGRREDSAVARALANLGEIAEMVRVLGSYPTRW
ncbi:MAG TPA: prephenate dehydratase [Thermoanaerobaculia bacterium]|nr:prephenate dehydratase [Thermoanaerobaculia bacterium]